MIEECEKTIKATVKPEASQHIRSLFELENGDTLAAKHIRQELEDQGLLNGLSFFLDELIKRDSKEFEPLASEIVTRAGQGQISFETLFWIRDLYLRPQTSVALKTRFLRTIVARTQIVEPTPQFAYDLLSQALPFIRQFVPELYEQALNQHVAMRASLNDVDGSKKADLLVAGVKSVNNFPKPHASARDKSTYQTYVQRLDNTGYELVKGFQSLTKQDENGALALIERLQKPDLRTFA